MPTLAPRPIRRRPLLLSLAVLPWLGLPQGATAAGVASSHEMRFPRDFGAHDDAHIEWWYATGWLTDTTDTTDTTAASPEAAPAFGFQITFFRARTEVAAANPSRFAATQLIFAHAALTDLRAGRLRHDQRIARGGFGIAAADAADTAVVLRDWQLRRDGAPDASRYRARVASDAGGFRFDLELAATQPVLLQGEAGFSRKGPQPEQASLYYSEPQLAVGGTLTLDGRAREVRGRAWLDHEWSDTLLDPQAVGWDWIGFNLDDGGALTAFRLRRADGSTVYAGGSHRPAGGATRNFGPDEVSFTPGRRWLSPRSRASYPVAWDLRTPLGATTVRALLDDQELDSRGSTGSVYWEGLSEMIDSSGRRIGRGYLEMTGYVRALKL